MQQVLAGAQQDRPHDEMQLVDQAGAQVLANGGDAPAEADVTTARGCPRLLQRGVNASVTK